jgi:hypothetical protein
VACGGRVEDGNADVDDGPNKSSRSLNGSLAARGGADEPLGASRGEESGVVATGGGGGGSCGRCRRITGSSGGDLVRTARRFGGGLIFVSSSLSFFFLNDSNEALSNR